MIIITSLFYLNGRFKTKDADIDKNADPSEIIEEEEELFPVLNLSQEEGEGSEESETESSASQEASN